MDEPRRRSPRRCRVSAISYDLGEGHPLLGRRMPDLDLVTADGPLRVFTLLHAARPVLLNFGAPGSSTSRRGRIGFNWSTPLRGCLGASGDRGSPGPTAVLVRPDGHVAWVGDRTQPGLIDALTTWFGPHA